jgi:predicted amidophosphoribosyltransferase
MVARNGSTISGPSQTSGVTSSPAVPSPSPSTRTNPTVQSPPLPARIQGWDAIVPSPTFTGPGSRRQWDHIGLILDRATVEAADRWPQLAPEPGLIVKTVDTPSLVGKTWVQRRTIAETEIRASLHLPDPSRVAGRRFLVFDDVFTDGSTLREIARALLIAGAEQVGGLVLARQPWSS